MLFKGFREGIFECCSPASFGKPEFLYQTQHITSRVPTQLFKSASGGLQLYFHKWRCEQHHPIRSIAFIHHGETDHGGWYNALAVRLASVGCASLCLDAQGFGQSDGVRGYFESFEDLVNDFANFVREKWPDILEEYSNGHSIKPRLVLVGKGLGALVVMRVLTELREFLHSLNLTPLVVLISPAFRFANFIESQSNVSCGLNSAQCARQPAAQCARAPVAFTPIGEDAAERQKLGHASRWFPKMIVTAPIEPDMMLRDPEAMQRMTADVLCWHEGYRARVLAEVAHEQGNVTDVLCEHSDLFQCIPALILHGSGDKLYCHSGSHFVHSIWCDKAQSTGIYPRLKIYDGAHHQLLNEPNREEVLNDITLFIATKSISS